MHKEFSDGQIDASILLQQQIIYATILVEAKLKTSIFSHCHQSHPHTDQVQSMHHGEFFKKELHLLTKNQPCSCRKGIRFFPLQVQLLFIQSMKSIVVYCILIILY